MSYALKKITNNHNNRGFFNIINGIEFNDTENRNVTAAESAIEKNKDLKSGLYISSQWDIAEYNTLYKNSYNAGRDSNKNKYCVDYIELNKKINITNTEIGTVTKISDNIIPSTPDISNPGLTPGFNESISKTLLQSDDVPKKPYFEFLFPLRLSPMNCDIFESGDEVYSACVEYPILHFRIWNLHDIEIFSNIRIDKNDYSFSSTRTNSNIEISDDSKYLTTDSGDFDVKFNVEQFENIGFYPVGNHFDCRIIFPKKQKADNATFDKTLIFYSQIISACMGINKSGDIMRTIDNQEIYIKGMKDEDITQLDIFSDPDGNDTLKVPDDTELLRFTNFSYSLAILEKVRIKTPQIILKILLRENSGITNHAYKGIKPTRGGANPYFKVSNTKDYLTDQIKISKSALKDSDFCTKIINNPHFQLQYFIKGKKYHDDLNLEYYPDNSGFKINIADNPARAKTDILKNLEEIKNETSSTEQVTKFNNFARAYINNIRWDLIRSHYYLFRGRDNGEVTTEYSQIESFQKINVLHSNNFEQTNFSNTLQAVCFSSNMLGYYAFELPTSILDLLYKDAYNDTYEVDLKVLYKLILKDIIGVSVTSV